MSYNFQNRAPRAPTGLRSRYDGVAPPVSLSFGVGHAGARPIVDQYGNISRPPATMQMLLQEAYSMGITNIKEDLDQRYLVENEDFPDAFNMPNFNEVFMARVSEKTSWMNQCMPEHTVDSLQVGGDCLIFNHTQPERLPEESVPNYMTHEREKWSDTLIRWGKGILMERNFFHTAVGRAIFYYQLEQLNNIIALAQNHSRACALFYEDRKWTPKRSDRLQEYDVQLGSASSGKQLLKLSFQDFGILNRQPTKIQERVAQWTLRFQSQCDGRSATRIIFPQGSASTWKYAELGPYSQTGIRLGQQTNFQRQAANGMNYCESFGTRLDDGRIDHDPSYNDRTIGGYFTIDRDCWVGPFQTEGTSVQIFDESQDQLAMFRLQNNAKFFGIWANYDQCDRKDASKDYSYLSDIGEAYMKGITNYWDLYKSQAPQKDLDEVCKSIASKPSFIKQIVERIYELQHSSESSLLGVKPMSKETRELLSRVVPNLNIPVHPNDVEPMELVNDNANVQSWLSGRKQPNYDDYTSQQGQPSERVQRLTRAMKSSRYGEDMFDHLQNVSPQFSYRDGNTLYVNVEVNRAIEESIQSKPRPSSAMEKFLIEQNPEQFDQPFLQDNEDRLYEIQQKELQYLNTDHLNLFTNDGFRGLNFPALLFPLSIHNVVLFKVDELDFLKNDKWIETIFQKPTLSQSSSFYNSSYRMALLFHSIEVSVLYNALKNNVNVKPDMFVQKTSPNKNLMDWTQQIDNARRSNLDVPNFQTNYQRDVQSVRDFLVDPSASSFNQLKTQLGVGQSRTSGKPLPHQTTPTLDRYNETLSKVSVGFGKADLKKFQDLWHDIANNGGIAPKTWIVKAATELPDPVKELLWDHVNKITNLSTKQFDGFLNNLVTMLTLVNAMVPALRFKDTPLEHGTAHNISNSYIQQASAFVIIDPDATIKHIDNDIKMMFYTRKDPVELKQKFSPVMNGVLIDINENSPSISGKLIEQFANFRLNRNVKNASENQKYYDLAKLTVNTIKFVNEDNFNITINHIKDETTKLASYLFELLLSNRFNPNANIFDELYEKTSISLVYPDLRQLSSQSISGLILTISQISDIHAQLLKFVAQQNYTRGYQYVFGAFEMFKSSNYINGRLGDWQADLNKIIKLAIVLRSNGTIPITTTNQNLPAAAAINSAPPSEFTIAQLRIVNSQNNQPPPQGQQQGGVAQDVQSQYTYDDVIQLLSHLTVEDAWFYKRCFEYEVIPPIGGRFCRPHTTYEMGTLVMCIDGAVGGLHSMPPSISAGEDPKNQMMHMTFAQYYKGIIYSGKELMRVHDVYCRRYRGGNGITVWDPLDPTDKQKYRSGHDLAKSIFAIPMPMWTDNSSGQPYDLTGEYPYEFHTNEIEQERNRYAVSQVLCEIWGWTNTNAMKEDNYYNTSHYLPRFNTIMAQDHTGRLDRDGKYTRTIENCGAWGPNIYNGCSFDRCGMTLRDQYQHVTLKS